MDDLIIPVTQSTTLVGQTTFLKKNSKQKS